MAPFARNYGNIRIPKWRGFYVAVEGYPYNHSTEAAKMGLRENGTLTIKPATKPDANGRPIHFADDVEFTAALMQTDLPAIESYFKISRRLHSLWLPSAFGDYYSFVDNTATPAEPNGSSLVGLHWKLTIDKENRSLEGTWKTRLFQKETDWLFANMASLASGGSGGSAIGISNMAYDRTKFREPNFVGVTVDGNNVGVFSDAKIELESSGFTDNRNREIMQYVTANCEVTMGQSAADELVESWRVAKTDVDIVYHTPFGEQFQFINGSVTTSPEHTHSDKEAMIKLVFKGEVPITEIAFGSGTMTFDFAG